MRRRSGPAGERGLALPSWAIGASVGVVVVALLTFVVTGSPDRGDEAAANPVSESTDPSDDPSEPAETKSPEPEPTKPDDTTKRPRPDRDKDKTTQRRDAYVEIYNNTSISGLANQTAAELQDTGWKVVGVDNWYGEIPADTVYYPQRLRDTARQLADDLGIGRLHVAVPPMRFDRLTVILTGSG